MTHGRSLARIATLPLTLAAGCATGRSFFPPDSAARPAYEAPPRFNDPPVTPVQMGTVAPSAPGGAVGSRSAAPPACRAQLVDPRNGTSIRLVRSQRGERGDYESPGGGYGLKSHELLRIDCRTNRTVGIVPR